MADRTQVLILGAGAIGAFYGGVLARAGCEVSVVARSDRDAVAAGGYRIESTLGDLSFRPARVLAPGAEWRGEADFVLVALKLTRGVDRVALIGPLLSRGSAIVLAQNGIDIEGEVARAFPDHELISCVAYAAVTRVAPGEIRHHSSYTRLVLGRHPFGISPAAARFAELVKAGGANVQLTEDIVGARWQKCAWNSVFNPISALVAGLGTRAILETEEGTRLVREAMAEVCAIASAAGHPRALDTATRQIAGTLRMPDHVSSMGQDALAGRPMETEALLGNVVRAARRLAVPAPRLETLYALCLMREQAAPGQAASASSGSTYG